MAGRWPERAVIQSTCVVNRGWCLTPVNTVWVTSARSIYKPLKSSKTTCLLAVLPETESAQNAS